MKRAPYTELLDSVKEGAEILNGTRKPSRVSHADPCAQNANRKTILVIAFTLITLITLPFFWNSWFGFADLSKVRYPYHLNGQDDDYTHAQSNICEVHRVQMVKERIPILWGLPDFSDPLFAVKDYDKDQYPNASRFTLGGCVITEMPPPTHAKVYHCPDCIKARDAARERAKSSNPT
jgi:hypothetical protein